jgi:hypothetical protein
VLTLHDFRPSVVMCGNIELLKGSLQVVQRSGATGDQ